MTLMARLQGPVTRMAEAQAFSGVVRVDRGECVELAEAYGFADRAFEVPNTLNTQFAIASATKALTALAVVSLVEEGRLEMATTARRLLGDDLPLVDDEVTIEQLLAHRSGIGDYVDEEAGLDVTDYVLPVPVHELATTEGYLRVLEGWPAKFRPGERFSYCNSGYVVLALMIERVTGTPFEDLVVKRVCEPAGLRDTAFLRSDELPGRAARSYLSAEGLRTNVLHLPVRGSGDGGIYSTVADIRRLWRAFFDGRVVSGAWVAEMVRSRSDTPNRSMGYGLGFWLDPPRGRMVMEGYDAGVSFRSVHDPASDLTHTVVSNTSEGAWPIARYLDEVLSS